MPRKSPDLEYTVLVFDICSSTVFIEDLVKTDELDAYCGLIESLRAFILNSSINGMSIYKFVGDGFILLFETGVAMETVLRFTRQLAEFARVKLDSFLKDNIETTAIPRIGITVGIDVGPLRRLDLNSSKEFVGRPLNLAARLQGSLKEKEHVNKILMSVKAYKKIEDPGLKKACAERQRVFRNISENNRTRCYELNALGG